MKVKEKDECSYSFLNAIRTLVMVRETGLEPVRQRHTHLKRACLPVPALALNKGYYTSIKKQCQDKNFIFLLFLRNFMKCQL